MSDTPLPSTAPSPDAERPDARTDLRGYLADFGARMTRLQERAADSQDRLAAVSATGASSGGEVTVTVGAGGALTDIAFTSEVRRTSPESLSDMVKEAYGKAVTAASAQSTAAVTGLLGEGTPALADFEASLRRRTGGGEEQ
ncbi:YbaB/EbfC family nucleoid-associated protein [Glycomyces harbinensis]|uniref:Conserved DNA-binding protein YbaB n=1 Tax=Glycomyces harbinensis TaxID=58114 RepID=A0A1G6VP68_9ACTN|nr:YbaB/EbfC family nucleoid-associated protein [Glycomyces harbinensis]SDD54797.1 Conserved DNA-binding protein YbaB [Glycomyces harbinensis]